MICWRSQLVPNGIPNILLPPRSLQARKEKHLTLGEATQFHAISGQGVTAHVASHSVAVGNTDLIDDLDVAMPSVGNENLDDIIETMERLSAEGKTPMLAAIDGEACGNRGRCGYGESRFATRPIAALKSHGVNVVMLTETTKQRHMPWQIKLASAT